MWLTRSQDKCPRPDTCRAGLSEGSGEQEASPEAAWGQLTLLGLEVSCKPESSARIPLRDQEESGRDQGQARW